MSYRAKSHKALGEGFSRAASLSLPRNHLISIRLNPWYFRAFSGRGHTAG